ncbi:MAG: hypothetical protein O2955_13720 [Planctomycetota bacterium]|nr:hypothetical protein [Planctomycetota bacterium]MDA1213568.1 hypothetical protein [Planctomycetota bacterium]
MMKFVTINASRPCDDKRLRATTYLASLLLVVLHLLATNRISAEEQTTDLSVEQLEKAVFKRVAGGAPQGACLDVGPSGSWFSYTVGLPTVHFDGEMYRMWFIGDETTKDPKAPYGIYQRVGLATSVDGIHWEIANDGKPVLDLGPPGSADAKGIAHPYVLKVGEKFWMWYGAIDGNRAGNLGLTPANVRVERICLATSDDGIHWERTNEGKPVFDIGAKGTIDGIQATGMHILKIDDEFKMWYGACGSQKHTITMATSPDGIHWTRSYNGEPITGLVGGVQGQLGASVYFDGNRYFMLYGGDLGQQWRTYSAVSDDGFHFTQLNDGKPILDQAPAGNFDTAGRGRNHVTHPTQFVVTNGKIRIWYMGEDGSPPNYQRIGLMEADIP